MAKAIKHGTVKGATSETHPWLFNEDGTSKTQESNPGLFKADGTPRARVDYSARAKGTRRPNADVIAEIEALKVKVQEDAAARLAKLDGRIAKLLTVKVSKAASKVDPAVAAQAASDLLAAGYNLASIAAMEQTIKNAKAALAGKSPEELVAMTEAAMASKTAAVTYDEPEDGEAAE